MWQTFLHKWLKAPYQLYAHQYHNPKHPRVTVILLHGIGSSYKMWDDVAKKLPQDARVIAVDMLGFGRSPKPEWKTYHTKAQADSIVTTLLTLRVSGPIVVVGHSLGALVAVEFARRYPILVRSLVLISPPIFHSSAQVRKFAYKPEEFVKLIYKTASERPDDVARLLQLAAKYRLVNRGFDPKLVNAATYIATLDASIINQTTVKDVLKLRQPTHIVTGKFDPFVMERNIKYVVKNGRRITWNKVLAGHEISGLLQRTTIKAIKSAINDVQPGH